MALKSGSLFFVFFCTLGSISTSADTVKGSIENLIHDDEGIKVVMVNKKTNQVRSTYLRNNHPDFIKMRDALLESQKNKKPLLIQTSANSTTDIQATSILKSAKK